LGRSSDFDQIRAQPRAADVGSTCSEASSNVSRIAGSACLVPGAGD
jgi:hypothetical protein